MRPNVMLSNLRLLRAVPGDQLIADGVDEVRKAVRGELKRGAQAIKIMASGGVASPSDPIYALQYGDEEIACAVWEAKAWRSYVLAHAYTPESIHRAVRLGVRSIEHANLIDAATAAFMAEKQAFAVPTLVTYDALAEDGTALGLPPESMAQAGQREGCRARQPGDPGPRRGADGLRHRPAGGDAPAAIG